MGKWEGGKSREGGEEASLLPLVQDHLWVQMGPLGLVVPTEARSRDNHPDCKWNVLKWLSGLRPTRHPRKFWLQATEVDC